MEYRDKHGVSLSDGDMIRWDDGKIETVALTEDGELGTDATSTAWIKSGRAVPFEYGIYPLTADDLRHIEKIRENREMAL